MNAVNKVSIKTQAFAVLMLAFASSLTYAESTTPSDASIAELLQVMNARGAIDNAVNQVNGLMRSAMQQALQGRTPTPEQQKVMDDMLARMAQLYDEELSWDKLRPMYERIYKASFTQSEVDGMLTFYRSPTGRAVINKLPVVMQNTMVEMQKMMIPIMQKAQAAARDMQQELSNAKKNKEQPAEHAP